MITPFATTCNPTDGGTLYDGGPNVAATLPASLVAGDRVYLICARRSTADIVMGLDGGQSWTAGTLRQAGTSASVKVFSCRFNGTWTNTPTIVTINNATIVISVAMIVFRPTTGSNTWAVDVAEAYHNQTLPVSPFDVTATGQTSIATSTVTFAVFYSLDKNTWTLQTAGWSNAGSTQYRNADPTAFRNQSLSFAYKVQTSAAATGNVTNREATLGGDAGLWIILTDKEQGSGVTVASADDAVFHNGESGVVVTGTSFGASRTGSAKVLISPTNNIADASAVSQPSSAWGDTSVTLSTLALSSFGYFTNLYLFITNSSGQSNGSGFVVQREAIANLSVTVKTIAGTTEASLTGLTYEVNATDILGTLLMSGTTESTDGSGVLAIGPYTLVSGGALAPNDDVWLTLCKNGATQALSFGTCVKLTPTYT